MASASAASASSAELEKQLKTALHQHARGPHPAYPARAPVPDEQVPWSAPAPRYQPTEFTAANVKKNSPDPADPRLVEQLTARASFETNELKLNEQGQPLNPRGRTGISGRGKLYMWGPNQAADPLVTREASPSSDSGSGELEVVVIQRGDTKEWALPGGMVDPGETPAKTAAREFGEEALAGHKDPAVQRRVQELVQRIFEEKRVEKVYAGYIDDPRNTDNSWLESSVFHAHLDRELASELTPLLRAGDDATEVRWIRIAESSPDVQKLYGSHKRIVLLAAAKWREKRKQHGQQPAAAT